MKSNKSAGLDELPSELLLVKEKNMDILVDLFNTIDTTGIFPGVILISTFVCLQRKVNATECSDYRTISLLSHKLKTLLKIIHARINSNLE